MEELLETYNLNKQDFYDFFNTEHMRKYYAHIPPYQCCIAGSAPLSVLSPFSGEPSDLDIWIYVDTSKNPYKQSKYIFETLSMFENISSVRNNYVSYYTEKCTKELHNLYVARNGNSIVEINFSKKILRYLQFTHKNKTNNKKLQVLITSIPIQDVINSFDLSICATWWQYVPEISDFKIFSYDLENTLKKQMYDIRPIEDVPEEMERRKVRIEKYKQRGFVYGYINSESIFVPY